MKDDYVIVSKKIMPKSYEGVLQAKHLIEVEGYSVSDACKMAKISRGSYYKYQDLIFKKKNTDEKKAAILIKAINIKGVLSEVLNIISKENGNILTINQDMPIHNIAHITTTIDIRFMSLDIKELISRIKSVENIKNVELLSIE